MTPSNLPLLFGASWMRLDIRDTVMARSGLALRVAGESNPTKQGARRTVASNPNC